MALLLPVGAMLLLVGIAWLMSAHKRHIKLRTVLPAFALQAGFAGLALYSDAGVAALDTVVRGVQHFIDYANAGIGFMFGPLGNTEKLGLIFAFHVLPVIVFIASLTSALYHLGIMQRIVAWLGGGLHFLTRTSKAESICAAGNIFIGQSETPLLVRPYLHRMTRSELFAVMTGGLASIAGSVMLAYTILGVELKYLIAACFMAAPGGLMMAKIILPETEEPEEETTVHIANEERPANLVDAIAMGAMDGAKLGLAIGAMLIAFIAMVAMLNGILTQLGDLVGIANLTFEQILGWLLAPLAYLLGVAWEEATTVASLIGQKLVLNEFVAFVNLTTGDLQLSDHSRAVATFALCGFANISSIAILLGGLGGLAPSQRPLIAKLGFRAVAAASLANLMSAALASFFLMLQ
ncbi:MAG: nucleoside transporter C-terminal domain-containing protein [Pseudomonadota bacterium]